MNTLTAEWVEKAEGDFHSCLREVRARKHPNHDSACFHAQLPAKRVRSLPPRCASTPDLPGDGSQISCRRA